MKNFCYSFACFLLSIYLISPAHAQFKFPPLSSKSKVSTQVGFANVEIEYERPSARGRKIFGGLVPWNKVWRMGAGYCTKIRLSQEVQIGKQRIPAGSYSVHSIPNPNEWTIIINADTTLYGSFDYDIKKDVARFSVPVQKSARYYETFTIDIDVVPNNARIYVSWANTSLNFELKTSTDEGQLAYIQEHLLSEKSQNAGEYADAADYLMYQGTNLRDALFLANKSAELKGSGYAYRLQMELSEKFMLYEDALVAAKNGWEFAKVRELDDEKWRQPELDQWQEHIDRISAKLKR